MATETTLMFLLVNVQRRVNRTGLPCNCEGHEAAGANNGQVMSGLGNLTPPTA